EQVLEEVELIKEAGDAFNQEKIARGDQTPVFFGSALTNFGVHNKIYASSLLIRKKASHD
ncbi:hypothetical protein, partial [Enterococcus faecium]|uniref:hypothetical protein n=1 Tax=Enterococcus faecium TaxID=1352 RepID=UPI00292F99EB